MPGLGLVIAVTMAGWLLALPALAASFVLAGGETVEGAIVEATRNTIIIRRADGGMRQIPVGRLQRVRITTADGQTLGGPFRGWKDGRTAIMVGSEVVWIEHDQVVERTPLARPALAQDSPSAAGLERAAKPAPVALSAQGLPVVSVKTAPDDVTEATGEVVFTLELSRPLDDLLVVIYSTVDGAARAGTDYDALQGILNLPAGTTRGEIRTAITDHGTQGGDKDFSLFVAVNPDLATLAQQWTRVTIHDDD